MRNVLVTGAGGFIGQRLCEILLTSGHSVRAVTRKSASIQHPLLTTINISDLCDFAGWPRALQGVDGIVHLAGRAHSGESINASDRELFWRTNVEGTRALINHASAAGVRKIVFVSSSKVFAEANDIASAHPLSARDPTAPDDVYGESKIAAEQVLLEYSDRHDLGLTILRPPLVLGPGNKGNLWSLLRAIDHKIPLPIKSIQNSRSLIYLDSLIDAIVRALMCTEKKAQIYTLADCALSTPSLVTHLAIGMHRRAYLFPFPLPLLHVASILMRRESAYRRLTQSLVLDSSDICRDIGWQPMRDIELGFDQVGDWFHSLSTTSANAV